MNYPTIKLKPKRHVSILRRHPWIFSGGLAGDLGKFSDGEIVQVLGTNGSIMATGHFSSGSIAVRILSFADETIDASFYAKRLLNAKTLREKIDIAGTSHTTGYRLIHAEGDQLPGLVIDIYGNVAVVQAHSKGMETDFPLIKEGLESVYGNDLGQIVLKSAERNADNSTGKPDDNQAVEILENGNAFSVNFVTGQKTGFFLDQRDNRALIAKYAEGKKVLNAFSYSGGFSIYALKAGAKEVHSLDSSAKAIALVDENIKINGLEDKKHTSITAEAIGYLNSEEAQKAAYDIIVLDPPAFAKHRSARHRAVQAYKRLNANAFKLLKPGGMLFTFSCSQVVTPDLFHNTIAAAAIEAGRHIRVIHHLHQPADHPVSIFHPEGEYLKGLVLTID